MCIYAWSWKLVAAAAVPIYFHHELALYRAAVTGDDDDDDNDVDVDAVVAKQNYFNFKVSEFVRIYTNTTHSRIHEQFRPYECVSVRVCVCMLCSARCSFFNFCIFSLMCFPCLSLAPHTIYHGMACAVLCQTWNECLRMPVAMGAYLPLALLLAHHSCMWTYGCVCARALFFVRNFFLFLFVWRSGMPVVRHVRRARKRGKERKAWILYFMPEHAGRKSCCKFLFLERFSRCFFFLFGVLNYTRRS